MNRDADAKESTSHNDGNAKKYSGERCCRRCIEDAVDCGLLLKSNFDFPQRPECTDSERRRQHVNRFRSNKRIGRFPKMNW